MISTFLSHQWKEFWRSRNKGGSIATQIIIGFFIIYFLGLALLLGFGMPLLLPKIFPNQDIYQSFNGIILYFFALDFLMRLQLQELPTVSIVPYLHLNLPKSNIVRFLNVKALFSAFNLVPLFIFLPFCFMKIMGHFGVITGLMYILSIISLSLLNNYLALFIKRKSIANIAYIILGFLVVGSLLLLEYFKIIQISVLSNGLFKLLVSFPYLALLFCALAYFIFHLNSSYLYQNLYVEELETKKGGKSSTDYPFLKRFGEIGDLAAIELKLIMRHKRPRSSLLVGIFFLFYGFLFYKAPALKNNEFEKLFFCAVFITGFSNLSYGQFVYAWQSSYFDGILANKISLKNFIKAKFLLFTIFSTIITLLSSFYIFVDAKILLLHAAAYLYNIGISSVLILYLGTFNHKRLDIKQSATFNFQGTGASQWLLMIPFMLIPYIIYIPFAYFKLPFWGLFAIGIVSLMMLLMRGFWINLITKKLEQKRYTLAEGYRE